MAGLASTTASTMLSTAGDDALEGVSAADTAAMQFEQAELQVDGTKNSIDTLESEYEQSVEENSQAVAKNGITVMEIH